MNMKHVRMGLAVGLLSLSAVAGCGDADVGDDELADVGGEDRGGADLEVGEASEAIQVDAWNGSCAQSLTLRKAPNGGVACLHQMSWGTSLWVYHVSGNWAYVSVGGGPCGGKVGWVIKDYVSRNCLV